MDRAKGTLACEKCGCWSTYRLLHTGFSDSAYAYCRDCGMTAVLNAYRAVQRPVRVPWFAEVSSEAAAYLLPCPCGGEFANDRAPRCPSCKTSWSAERVTAAFEADAPGTAKGWRWQHSWTGVYFVIIEGRAVYNNWRGAHLHDLAGGDLGELGDPPPAAARRRTAPSSAMCRRSSRSSRMPSPEIAVARTPTPPWSVKATPNGCSQHLRCPSGAGDRSPRIHWALSRGTVAGSCLNFSLTDVGPDPARA
jgi:hypothetical protein